MSNYNQSLIEDYRQTIERLQKECTEKTDCIVSLCEKLITKYERVKELEEKLNAQFAEMEEKITEVENKNFELKENIKTIVTSLIIANHVDIGAIRDTIWVDNWTTLWDYIRIILDMNDDQFKEFEKQAIRETEWVYG